MLNITCQEVVERAHEVHPGPVVRDVVGNVQAFLPVDIGPQGHPWRESTTHPTPFPPRCWSHPSHVLRKWPGPVAKRGLLWSWPVLGPQERLGKEAVAKCPAAGAQQGPARPGTEPRINI